MMSTNSDLDLGVGATGVDSLYDHLREIPPFELYDALLRITPGNYSGNF